MPMFPFARSGSILSDLAPHINGARTYTKLASECRECFERVSRDLERGFAIKAGAGKQQLIVQLRALSAFLCGRISC